VPRTVAGSGSLLVDQGHVLASIRARSGRSNLKIYHSSFSVKIRSRILQIFT
jgi:hypothetical protein